MSNTGVTLIKIWEDENFFEISLEVRSIFCISEIKFYTDNSELDELRQGLLLISSLSDNEYIWTSGEDKENTTHYVQTRWYVQDKRGHIGVEFILDNKDSAPDKMRSHSFVVTELNQLDDFINQLQQFIKGKSNVIKGLLNSLGMI
ncbi:MULTISPECIES: hypothetical protein [Paenibacillus]|uniref:Uncharacterized protein n=1 Tax=Paenibacillus violae TaxID=3077234 RepID=A0ABU3RNW2_9BACL|nr:MULTISPECIES: hypothetical protein [Paenibacillus]MDU0205984.1 hypothetical protein [Paenibacillus sp. PFR10]MEC0271157.1 hypothetical protein [Paenibacillus anseongense]